MNVEQSNVILRCRFFLGTYQAAGLLLVLLE